MKKGIWEITKGKNNRVYIECKDGSKIMHPEQLCKMNGLGIYGHENLKDLAIAILIYEKEKQIKMLLGEYRNELIANILLDIEKIVDFQ